MRKRVLGALLLPLPFAALPVVVVLIGAASGSNGPDELVTREDPTAVITEFVSTNAQGDTEVTLARSSSTTTSHDLGCDDSDLLSES
ncbi:MAG: hypothetical protein AB7N24_19275 [Dehalococcoidia bacterium]